MKKITSLFLLASFILSLFPPGIFALSTAVNSPENYPGKIDTKNVNGLGKNLSNDFFGGAMTFRFPFTFPSGSRGMTPALELSYSSNNTDAFSPYGYGFSLSLPRIQRSAKKGVSELYTGDEFSAFGNDLIPETGSNSQYRSKDGNDTNLYTKTASGWIVTLSDGKKLTFGTSNIARIADPLNPNKIYAWMLESEEDIFGHRIQYEYIQSGSQSFLTRILYGFDGGGKNPLYEIRFSYIDKATSLSSYKTQFEIKTTKLLSDISLFVSGNVVRSYAFSYDNSDTPVSHLISITEMSPSVSLPKIEFSYGEGQFRHMITKIDNNRGGVARFEYAPSTGYRMGSGELLNSKLPFMVMTLARQTLEDTITGIKDTEQYEYASGAYYYESSDIWGREYVGFGKVSIIDAKRKKVLSFYQSQTAEKDVFKFDDHIAKKGRLYRTQILDVSTDTILQEERIQYDMYTLFSERRLVFPKQKLQLEYGADGQMSAKAESYLYDKTGNLLEEVRHGFVSLNPTLGTWVDIPGDESKIVRTYTENPILGITKLPVSERVYGFSAELLSSSRVLYDGLGSGAILGLITTKILEGNTGNLSQREIFSYSPTGMTIEKKDALGNTTTSVYDQYDIALISTKNPLGWETRYAYNYNVGKPEQVTNHNNVISRTTYDAWGREQGTFLNFDGTDILLSEKSYDDITLPNSITSMSYFDTSEQDKKLQKAWLDGWGRTISTLSSMKDDGQYSISHVRYDMDGNPLYASYPYLVSTLDFTKDALPYGDSDNGEQYRTKLSGVSYNYDALGRIIREKTSRGVTEKIYAPNTETLINALGYRTMNSYDAYGNLVQVRENDGTQDITTQYSYDALGRPILLTDARGHIRTWQYDTLGRLMQASDTHTPDDTTYGVRQYTYDILGRVNTYENANGEVVSYTYDAMSRPLTESLGDLGIRTYVYDIGVRSLGTLSSVTDRDTVVSYIYDALGRKLAETRTLGNTPYSLSYIYDIAGTLTSVIYPDGGKTVYGYKNGFADTVEYTDAMGVKNSLITSITYSPNSTMNTMSYGNGVIKTVDRDADYNYRLERVRSTLSGAVLLDTSYNYDAVSNITRIQEGGIEPLRKTIDYAYDSLGRLTHADMNYVLSGYGRDTQKNLSYAYDPLGNILSATSVGNYTYSGEGYANPHAVTTAGDTNYAYDRAGNTTLRITPDAAYGFTYSPYGEMLSSTKDGEKTTYAYDHTKRRVIKSGSGLLEHHVIDGYEVEYESGAIVANYEGTNSSITNTGTTNSGLIVPLDNVATGSGSGAGELGSGGTSSGSTDTGAITTSPVANTGTILSESGLIESGSTSTGSTTGETSTGTSNTGTENSPPDSGSGVVSESGESNSGTMLSGGIVPEEQYAFIAGYTSSGGTPATLITTLTHIMLGDERIATFQTQNDDSPKTLDDDKLIYHLSDHLNSSSLDLSSTGLLLQATDYEPFGKSITYEVSSKRIKGKKGGYTNKYQFLSKQLDEESDLQYFEKRYYDNRIGRFTTEDPVYWEVGRTKRPSQYFISPQNWNSYSYTINNPINLVDPTGESPTDNITNMLWGIYNAGYTSIMNDLKSEAKAYQQAGQIVVTTVAQNAPITGDANDASIFITGNDLYSGENIEGLDRWLSGGAMFLVGINGRGLEAGKETIETTAKGLLRSSNSAGTKIVKSSMLSHFNSGRLGQLGDFTQKYQDGGQEHLMTLPITLNDTRYPASEGWVLRSYNQTTQAGVSVDLHFMQNTKTGETANPHFKQ